MAEPFGGPDMRRATVAGARATAARQNRARKETRVHLASARRRPTRQVRGGVRGGLPGYGARLVWLAFGTGLRINEALALRHDSIDLDTLEVAVDWQLDRYGTWPALALPKGNKTRATQLWACYSDVAASLIEDALDPEGPDHGWLFPRHRSVKKWADQAGKLAGAAPHVASGRGVASTGCATASRPGASPRSRTAATASTRRGSRSGWGTRS